MSTKSPNKQHTQLPARTRLPSAQESQLDLLSDLMLKFDEDPDFLAEQSQLEDDPLASLQFDDEADELLRRDALEGDELEEDELNEADEREQRRLDDFFRGSLINTKAQRDKVEPVSRKVNVGLYPSDAKLLEELYKQSKLAGLKNVSRARILRVALRHFHTCWLNQR